MVRVEAHTVGLLVVDRNRVDVVVAAPGPRPKPFAKFRFCQNQARDGQACSRVAAKDKCDKKDYFHFGGQNFLSRDLSKE